MSDEIENGQESEAEDTDDQASARLNAKSMENLANWARDERGQHLQENRAQRNWRRQKDVSLGMKRETSANLEEDSTLATEDLDAALASLGVEPVESKTVDETTPAELTTVSFGKDGGCHFVFEISDDQLTATLIHLTIASDEGLVSVPDLKTLLSDEAGICYGVDDDALTAVIDGVTKGIFEKRIVIARGKKATSGTDGQVNYPYLERLKNGEAPYGEVAAALAFDEVEQFAVPEGLRTLLVTPGQTVVEITEATEGEEGMTVCGEPIQQPGIPAKNAPKPGEGLTVDKGTYQATIYGYPYLTRGILHVLSPIWVAPDFMSAAFVQLPLHHPCAQPQSDWIMELLAAAGVVHGISEPDVERLCREPSEIEARLVVLANGEAAVHGEDAHFEPAFDMSHRPGRVLESGAIEFRDRNKGVAVEEGDRLGTVSFETMGVDGMDVRGQKLPATDGKSLEFSSGEGVRTAPTKAAADLAADLAAASEEAEEAEEAAETAEEMEGTGEETRDNEIYYADCDGAVLMSADKIEVLPIVTLSGNVDYDTGHIDTRGDVVISGSVLFGFHVRAGGNVTIGGRVENGALVEAGGNVSNAFGVIGHKARVVAGGHLETKIIQNAHAVVEGNLLIGNCLFQAHIHVGGHIEVKEMGGKGAGSIVGGICYATKGITSRSIGSGGLEHTVVGCRLSPSQEAGRRYVLDRIKELKVVRDDAQNALGIAELTKSSIGAIMTRLSRLPDAAQKDMRSVLRTALEAAKELGQMQEQLREFQEQREEVQKSCVIHISAVTYSEVMVEYEPQKLTVTEARGAWEFSLNAEGQLVGGLPNHSETADSSEAEDPADASAEPATEGAADARPEPAPSEQGAADAG